MPSCLLSILVPRRRRTDRIACRRSNSLTHNRRMLHVRFPFRLPSIPVFNSSSTCPRLFSHHPSPLRPALKLQQKEERMAIGCDPELRLFLGGATVDGGSIPARVHSRDESLPPKISAPSHHQMTIFYNGRVCVYDATEIQARTILSMAKKEMDELAMNKKNSPNQEEIVESAALPRPQILNPAAGLSMKRSLQRFLQKRKGRISDISPYSQKPKLLLFPVNSQQQN